MQRSLARAAAIRSVAGIVRAVTARRSDGVMDERVGINEGAVRFGDINGSLMSRF